MNVDFVILGGGIAGLSAAVRLTELGAKPWVIEAGEYPSHKVCGEFFSPECIEILKRWGISPIEIGYARFNTPTETLKFQFPSPAGSLSHVVVDPLLMQKAKDGGAVIKTLAKVEHLEGPTRTLKLDSGELIQANHLILATGRIPNYINTPPNMQYMGIKAHFEGFNNHDALEMFSFRNAYLGISPIERNKFNVAGLVGIERVKKHGTPEKILEQLVSENQRFKDYFSSGRSLFPNWMSVMIPAFGLRTTPHWDNSYFIGDGAGTIPPATGNGLTMAITGGILAAEYAIQNDAEGFRRDWHNRYASQIRWGKFLHQIMMSPRLSNAFIKIAKAVPFLSKAAYELTHHA